ncbi:bifunctional folylpolyglutamate synthase/dihydrofolate synthase [Limnoglobus roseus]|uniref:Dihydrofolate synthase/folylpolyglutamate synthase n=1 Tax=Limnoglobus roseus TaxID=2598579 RepID=A0A5C1APS5_9BACT|nr:folylpolyglutamate synthase/dihydrofolate synthase family protein [Limnoglobus roseus]QEL20026.1 bifunctional folylpolyglutamate synthase/dihydrofolate synthase [Limnoglobus roseus]
MTYDEAIAFWYGRINFEVKAAKPSDLKLERMRSFLSRLGDPQDRVRIVHITGTKGKGSTAAMIAAALRASGYRVGLFTSPHLVHVEERIQVDGQPITPGELAALVAELAPVVRECDRHEGQGPTFFEIGTALGFLHFVRRRADLIVLEVGLGGRFDSTNVCRPLVSVITSVGFDHVAQLGQTLEAIAFQKAGIIKPRVPVISGVTEPGPAAVIEEIAREQQAPLFRAGREFRHRYRPPAGVAVSLGGRESPEFALKLRGEHQAMNAAVAVVTLDRLRATGLRVPTAAVERGLATVHWPARIEVIRERPVIILDTAHNVPSAMALVRTLRESFPAAGRKVCVLAVSSDKQYPEMLAILGEYFDYFHLTRYSNNARSVPPEKLAPLVAKPYSLHQSALAAWQAAKSEASADDLVCITGSVFLAGELQEAVRD